MPKGDRKKGPKRGRYGEGSVYLKNGSWTIKYYEDGQPKYKSSRDWTKKAAQEELRERLGRMDKGHDSGASWEKTTFQELAELCRKDYEKQEFKSRQTLECRLKNLEAYFGKHSKAKDINQAKITDYVLARRKNPKGVFKDQYGRPKVASNATINRDLSILSKMFTLGKKHNKVPERLEIEKIKEPKARQGWISREEVDQLLKHLPDDLRPVIQFAWATGCRKGEIFGLKWSNINRKENSITLIDTKNGEPRTFFMTKAVRGVIDRQFNLKWHGSGRKTLHVFHRNGKPINDIRKAWAKATEAIGRPGLLFHDFRRSAARYLLQVVGLPEKLIMEIGGWKTRSVFDRYAIVVEDDLREAAKRIDEMEKELAV